MKIILLIFLIGVNVLLMKNLKKVKKENASSMEKHETLLTRNKQLKTLLGANSSFEPDSKHPTETNAAQNVSILAASVSNIH